MLDEFMIITNNPLVLEKFKKLDILYKEENTLDTFIRVRDMIHKGHVLLTHPLLSSIKPNETIYRTVLVSKMKEKQVDIDSLNIIEQSIETTRKFLNNFLLPEWNEKIREDFMYIDYDIISNVIN
ncbi:MAG: GrdX family protein [Bacillota bacterium]|nr:GrdX family protein [Bacillota bacterium]